MTWKDYCNRFKGQTATVVGKGRTGYDYAKLADEQGPIVFINDSVQLAGFLKNQPAFHFFLDQDQARKPGNPRATSVCKAEHATYCRQRPHMVYRAVSEVPCDGRAALARDAKLVVKKGTITPVLHFLWYTGVSKVRFVGCDGLNDRSTGAYDARLRVEQPNPKWQYDNIRKVQDGLVELFGFEVEYVGTPSRQPEVPETVQLPVVPVDCGRIGVAITAHNRPDLVKTCVEHVLQHTKGCQLKLVVVDDGSREPVCIDGAEVIRNDKPQGIAFAKNQCLAALERAGCDHLFLLDDDTYPIVDNWWTPYVTAQQRNGECHLALHWRNGTNIVLRDKPHRDPALEYYSHSCGCMLYFHRSVLDKVGGMDSGYGRWGYEHWGYSQRIANAGLCSHPFTGCKGANSLFYALDREQPKDTVRSVDRATRQKCLTQNTPLLKLEQQERHWKPYTVAPLVIGCLLTTVADPQRVGAKPIASDVTTWVESCKRFGHAPVLLTDSPTAFASCGARVVPTKTTWNNPYVGRLYCFADYLRRNVRMLDKVWLTDVTDVEMLQDPFPRMTAPLYLGDEPEAVGDSLWLRNQVKGFTDLERWIANNPKLPMLNPGLLGGQVVAVQGFLRELTTWCDAQKTRIGQRIVEMPLANMVGHRLGAVHGSPVNSRFKGYALTSSAWWRHK
jgi:hypothetical protein